MAGETPESIQGGCLCGSVRYTITFPPDHSFTTECSTCQCVQCRKNTGSLLARFHGVPTSAVVFDSPSTLKRFYATPHYARGFCGECGGFLFWTDEHSGHMAMTVGAFDKDELKRWGTVLTNARIHLWCEDEIPGVTDHLQGKRCKLDREGE